MGKNKTTAEMRAECKSTPITVNDHVKAFALSFAHFSLKKAF